MVAQCASAATHRRAQNEPNGGRKACAVGAANGAGTARWRDTRAEERLVGIDVAHARNGALI
jgi:hypothetical protein